MAGHPPLYDSKEKLSQKIDEYFESREIEFYKNEDGEPIMSKGAPMIKSLNAPSVTGLALYLGYASRQSIYDNEKNEQFSYIIKRARAKVEEWVYQASMSGTIKDSVGIFILKQFGYSDRQDIDLSVKSDAYDELKELYRNK
jgi:hypothetical protein